MQANIKDDMPYLDFDKTNEPVDLDPNFDEDEGSSIPLVVYEPPELEVSNPNSNKLESDFEFARKSIQNTILQGNAIFKKLSEVINTCDSPKVIELASGLIKALNESNHQLLKLHAIKSKEECEVNKNLLDTETTINNNTIICTNSELIDKILESKERLDHVKKE